jgi:hypothetical protein
MNPYQSITRFRARRPRPISAVDEFLSPERDPVAYQNYRDSGQYAEERNRELNQKYGYAPPNDPVSLLRADARRENEKLARRKSKMTFTSFDGTPKPEYQRWF